MTEPINAVLGRVGGALIFEALSALPGVEVTWARQMEEVPGLLEDAPVLVTFRWSDDWIRPGLRWVQSISAGTDQYPLEALRENGTVLTSARGVHEVQVSEHAIALLLAMTRGVAESARQQEKHNWQWPPVADLSGLTVGVLGLGTIGEGVARRLSAFGMQVIGTKRDPGSYRGVASSVLGPDDTREVFRRADAVIITLPGGEETRGVVGADELAELQGGWLVNVGRGSVVDTGALVDALEAGVVRGAALDVFEDEPLPPESNLWDVPNLLITPHVAGSSPNYGPRLAAVMESNLPAFRGEGDWVNRVV